MAYQPSLQTASSIIRFGYVAAPLPDLTLSCPAVADLADRIRTIYANAVGMPSMILALDGMFWDGHTKQESVQEWLLAKFCDLPSIDRVLHLVGVTLDVQRVPPINLHRAADLARVDAGSFPINSAPAVGSASHLFWHIADRVDVISKKSAALIISSTPEATQ